MYPDSKVHGSNMRPTWVLSAPDGPHIDPMNLAIMVITSIIKTDETTCPFPNFNSAAIDFWEWISNLIPHFSGHELLVHAGIKVSPC